jgi:hypothetical protein
VGPSHHPSVVTRVKKPGHEADHTLPSNAEVKNEWNCTSIPTYDLWFA